MMIGVKQCDPEQVPEGSEVDSQTSARFTRLEGQQQVNKKVRQQDTQRFRGNPEPTTRMHKVGDRLLEYVFGA